jgi:hypothetical protein
MTPGALTLAIDANLGRGEVFRFFRNEPGNMVIYVAGYPAIMGLQPLYFRDSELARRARIPAESAQTKTLEDTLATASG